MKNHPKDFGTTASPSRLAVRVAGVLLATLAAASCTQASLEPRPAEDSNSNALVTVRGRVCTPPPDADGFPVKVVLVVDQSGSMCISDPPGSQRAPGFCEQLVANGIVPPGLTEPARVRALERLVAQFAPLPNVELAIVPFETNVVNVWPQSLNTRFGSASDPSLPNYINLLQSQLGKGTDYQGALAYAYSLIASDIEDTVATRPAILPRTRYVVVFLTDGTPYPRCSANDNLAAYADHNFPQLTWADSSSAVDFCNLLDPTSPDEITGFTPGTDRNQNYQLFSYVERLMELEETYNVGDIRMHTILLFNEAAVRNCGPICQDVYGTYPNATDQVEAAHQIARWTLQQMAQMGNGVFQEFMDGDIQNMGLGALDYSSLRSPNVLKRLILENLRAAPAGDKRIPDSDGDGLPDELDNSFTWDTSPYSADSDRDCFSDRFEMLHSDRGFIAGNDTDIRGCDLSATPPTCSCTDTDGDGLNEYEEGMLGSHTGLVDSDTDGIPDGLEARYRLNLLKGDSNALDTDGDLIPDAAEILAQTDPTRPDVQLFERDGYKYELVVEPRGSDLDPTCYSYSISNVRMVSPPGHGNALPGENLFKVWFGSAPASGVTSDYGEWYVGCSFARYAPPGVRDPLGPELRVDNFVTPDRLKNDIDYYRDCEVP